jgi:hypothetical protein
MKIFATRVWGLGFERIPITTFGSEGHLSGLLKLFRQDRNAWGRLGIGKAY